MPKQIVPVSQFCLGQPSLSWAQANNAWAPASRHSSLNLPPSPIPSSALGTTWSKSFQVPLSGIRSLWRSGGGSLVFPFKLQAPQVGWYPQLLLSRPSPRAALPWASVTESFPRYPLGGSHSSSVGMFVPLPNWLWDRIANLTFTRRVCGVRGERGEEGLLRCCILTETSLRTRTAITYLSTYSKDFPRVSKAQR